LACTERDLAVAKGDRKLASKWDKGAKKTATLLNKWGITIHA
jgi:hypothetical protein